MIKDITWHQPLQAIANFWDWTRASYTDAELEELVANITTCDMQESLDPRGPYTLDQLLRKHMTTRRAVRHLYARYGREIWDICVAGRVNNSKNSIAILARLNIAEQVDGPAAFEEFLVRNALKTVARRILAEQSHNIK
jgi:hypothetical protein